MRDMKSGECRTNKKIRILGNILMIVAIILFSYIALTINPQNKNCYVGLGILDGIIGFAGVILSVMGPDQSEDEE
jgi:uncharacterized membrane protein YbaN (DUF454 family)